MKASVIIPSRKREPKLSRTLESVNAAAAHWADAVGGDPADVEIIVSWDVESKGPSWARNRGLDRAIGEIVFFCDADDTVRQDFLLAPLRALERTGADLCLFSGAGTAVRASYALKTNAEVKAAYLPAFFGYSNDDVRRWNSGGDLMLLKEPGSVWLAAFRRDFLERNKIRFDETITFYEDAAFLSHCVALADSSVSLADTLYDYEPLPEGNLASGSGSRRHWDYKLRIFEFRKRLDELTGGSVWKYCEASCVFSALEMLRMHRRAGVGRREFRQAFRRYLDDPRVKAAIRSFPLSWRHPLVAAGVTWLRLRIR